MRQKGFVALSVFLLGLLPLMTGATADGRSYVSGYFALELDGVVVGMLSSAEGGHAVGAVVTEQVGPDRLAKKHIGQVKYEDITVEFGVSMTKPVYDWIEASLMGQATRKSGSIILMDRDFRETSRMTFTNALITEIGMPALDAASKDAAKMTLKFKPEVTRRKKGSGQAIKAPDTKNQKKWLPANFRLKIDGLEGPAARVNKIEAITIKQKTVTDDSGDSRDYEKEPGKLEFPNLVITLPESHANEFYDWHENFVINGNNGEEQEKGGTLEYLATDGSVLFTLTFKHLGIFKLAPDKVESGAEQIRRVKAEMYCEDIRFSHASK